MRDQSSCVTAIATVALLGLAVVFEHVLPPAYNRSSLLLVVFLILAPYLWISTVICDRRLARIRAEDAQASANRGEKCERTS